MIKKHALFLVFLPLVSILFSCTNSNSNIQKFRLSDEFYTSENKGLLYADFQSSISIKKEENATFASLVYLSGCPSCALFTPIVEEYATLKNMQFYAVDVIDLRDNDTELFHTIKYAPAFMIFKEGNFFIFLDSGNADQIDCFKSLSGFGTWFETYINVSPSQI